MEKKKKIPAIFILTYAAILLAAALLGACRIEPAAIPVIEDTVMAAGTGNDFPETLLDRGYYLSTTKWNTLTITVAWENPTTANAIERGWVRDAVVNSWGKYSRITFTGWNAVTTRGANIRILIEDVGPHTHGLGTQLNNITNGMSLNFTFRNWGCTTLPCSISEATRQSWIRSNAIHEFGHALGIAHEHNRPDKPANCTDAAQGTNGDTMVGPFDKSSIMNYCYNSSYNGKLSSGDIATIQQMYGAPYTYPPYTHLYIGYSITPPSYQLKVGTTYTFKVYGSPGQRFTFDYPRDILKGVYGGNDFAAFYPIKTDPEVRILIYAIDTSTNQIIGWDAKSFPVIN